MRRPQLRFRPAPRLRPVALGAAFAVLASCGGGAKPILLGAAGPWKEGYGAMNKMGIELAIAEVNSHGGVRGRLLEVVARDDEAQGTRAAEVAAEFVANPEIAAVIGHVNSGAMVAAAHVYDGELPAVATTATSPELTGISSWTFRVISSDSANGIALARFAATLGRRRAAIIYENNSYGRGLADAFQQAFAGEIVSIDPIPEGDTDLEPFVSYYAREKADIVFAAGTDVSGLALLREARRQGFDAAFLGGDGWTGIVTDSIAATGVYVGAPFTSEDPRPEAQIFVRAFRKKYGRVPDGNAALAYDATKLLARAIAEVGANRAAIRDWLAEVDQRGGVPGVTGQMRFRADGDPVGKSFVMTRVEKGLLEVAQQ